MQRGVTRQQPLHFRQKVLRQHGFKPLGNAGVQHAAVGRQQGQGRQPIRQTGTGRRGRQQRTHGLAAQSADFQGTLNALGIVRGKAGGGQRVAQGEFGMERGPAPFGGFLVQRGAEGGVGLWQVRQPLGQGFEIQHGAAHQQRNLAACGDVVHTAAGIVGKLRRRIGLGGRQQVDQVMRHGGLLGGGGLGRANVHFAVNQGRVDADNFHRQVSSQGQCQAGFARGGGA